MIRCNLQGSEMSLTPCGPWNQADQTLNLGSPRLPCMTLTKLLTFQISCQVEIIFPAYLTDV